MGYLFTPPTVDEPSDGTHRLFARVPIPRGVSLLVTGSTVTEKRYPTDDEVRAADRAYIGGHIYPITDDEAALLAAAGYGDGLFGGGDVYVDTYEERY